MTAEKKINLELPVGYVEENGYHIIFNTDETKELIGDTPIVVQGDSFEDAKSSFFALMKFHHKYIEKRSRDLDKWKPFQKGQWGHIGGNWFTVFGINFHFRRGNGMKGGRYVPFTKLNISVHNHWRTKKTTSNPRILGKTV